MNSQYGDVNYWNKRYQSEDSTYDWFKSYESFRHILKETVQLDDRILMLGCGNSTLSEDMYLDGYHYIVNLDYSSVVLKKMKARSEICSAMEWIVMDIRTMNFSDKSFDVIIEKGTLDALMVDEKDPWNIGKDTTEMLDNIFKQLSAFLNNDGRFISITFSQPHFRRKLLEKPHFNWSLDYFTVGDTFHYFIYVMTKGKALVTDPTNTHECNTTDLCMSATTNCDDLNFLSKISI